MSTPATQTQHHSSSSSSTTVASFNLLTYQYDAVDQSTGTRNPEIKRGFVQAKNEREARLQLRKQSLVATRLTLVTQHQGGLSAMPLWDAVQYTLHHHRHVALISQTISQALQEGFTLTQALSLSEHIAPSNAWELALIQLRQHLVAGQPITPALELQKKLWGTEFAELLIVSEQMDHLNLGFSTLAILAERHHHWHNQWQLNYWRSLGWVSLLAFTMLVWWLMPLPKIASLAQQHTPTWKMLLFSGVHTLHTLTHDWFWLMLIGGSLVLWIGYSFPQALRTTQYWLQRSSLFGSGLFHKFQARTWAGSWWAGLDWGMNPQEAFKLACSLSYHPDTQRMLGQVLTQLEHGYPLADVIDSVPHIHPHIRVAVRLSSNREQLHRRLWTAWNDIMMDQTASLNMICLGVQWGAIASMLILILDLIVFQSGMQP